MLNLRIETKAPGDTGNIWADVEEAECLNLVFPLIKTFKLFYHGQFTFHENPAFLQEPVFLNVTGFRQFNKSRDST